MSGSRIFAPGAPKGSLETNTRHLPRKRCTDCSCHHPLLMPPAGEAMMKSVPANRRLEKPTSLFVGRAGRIGNASPLRLIIAFLNASVYKRPMPHCCGPAGPSWGLIGDILGGAQKRGMVILSGAIIVVAISIAAGAFIRVWAFAVFALFVTLGFGILSFMRGSPTLDATVFSIAVLLVMEISYVGGVFFSGLWRRARRLSTRE